MFTDLIKYILVFLISMFKFIGGPALGLAYDLSLIGVVSMTVFGMMTTVRTSVLYAEWLGSASFS